MALPEPAQNSTTTPEPAHLANAARVLKAILAQRDPSRSWTVTVLPEDELLHKRTS